VAPLATRTVPVGALRAAGEAHRSGIDVERSGVVEDDAEVDRRDRVRELVVGAEVVEVVRAADVVLDERCERVVVDEGAVVVDRRAVGELDRVVVGGRVAGPGRRALKV
jgi:hypothetical protein